MKLKSNEDLKSNEKDVEGEEPRGNNSSSESDYDDVEDFAEDDDSLTESDMEGSVFSEDENISQSSDNDDSADDAGSGSDHDHQVHTDADDFSQELGDDGLNQPDRSGSDDDHQVEESDSSEDEVAPRNTIGDVPFEWYRDEEHIGYDIRGKKIKKKERQDKLDSFLASADDKKNWRKIYDEYNDEEVELTKHETKLIRRLLKGQAPHADFDPHAPYVDWFNWEDSMHPLSNAPEPKRRFIPSKWESKKVVAYVRAIRKGLIKFDKPKEEPRFYNLWADDSSSTDKKNDRGLAYIPAPKSKLPGHEESYNPSLEYIPSQEEIDSYQLMFEEDRPKFIPKRFTSLRSVSAYDKAVNETFERCLDLYLCPRARKKRINIDPESLKPKLPSCKDLKPYPTTCYLQYRGHEGAVMSISTESSGQWIASGSSDGTVRIWEVETGRCIRTWEIGEAVRHVTWNPLPDLPILAVSAGQDVFVLNTGLGNEEEQQRIKELLHVEAPTAKDDSGNAPVVRWARVEKHEGVILKHFKTVTSVEWHRKGDYFSAVMPSAESRAILIHQLSKKHTQRLPFKLHGIAVSSTFHPTASIFFVATKKTVRAFNLQKQKLVKKLETGLREISSIAVHPGGDNVIVGSREGKLCWFDMDLSSRPYRVLNYHPKDITNVAFHRSYPLFASCSEDCTACVYHGMVYSDLNQNPQIVAVQILRGHSSVNGRGVMDLKFHPRQPWLFTAGADSVIRLYCH